MARPNAARRIGKEENLAERVRFERELRGWTYRDLAKRMTDAGCAIDRSAIYKIEAGSPPRRITVDELVALSHVLEVGVEDLLVPMEETRRQRGKALADGIAIDIDFLGKIVQRLEASLVEFYSMQVEDEELAEFVKLQVFGGEPGASTEQSEDAVQVAWRGLGAAVADRAKETAHVRISERTSK